MLLDILLVIATIVFITVLIVKRFAYFHPDKNLLSKPSHLNIQELFEGNIHAWYIKGSENKVIPSESSISEKLILFCHGNAGNISHRISKIDALHNLGYSVLIFDYSGFGKSHGVPTEEMCYSNASMFVNYLLHNGVKKNDIVPYGESLGGAVASRIALQYSLNFLILESSIPGIKAIVSSWGNLLNPIMKFLGLFFNDFNTVNYLKRFRGQVLLLHSIHDEVIPYKITEEMRKHVTKTVNMMGSHNDPQIPWTEIELFLQ